MIQLLLEVGVSYVCADNKVEVRVAGLYLLYAVYFTQPCSPKVLVRLTLNHWCVLQQLHAELRQNKVRWLSNLPTFSDPNPAFHCLHCGKGGGGSQ